MPLWALMLRECARVTHAVGDELRIHYSTTTVRALVVHNDPSLEMCIPRFAILGRILPTSQH
jgi:hypothetical protein